MLIGRIIFLVVFTLIVLLLNYYIYRKISRLFRHAPVIYRFLPYIFTFLALSFPVGRVLVSFMRRSEADSLVIIGSFWFAAIVYLFLACLLIDLGRLIMKIFHITIPVSSLHSWRLWLGWSICLITTWLMIWGYWCARHPVIHHLDLEVSKQNSKLDSLHIVMVSDIHLGRVLGSDRLEKMVNEINQLQPELVLIAGDMMDDDVAHIIRDNKARAMRNLTTRYGIYGVTGNHDLFDQIGPTIEYLEGLGIQYLRDSVAMFPESFYLLGRDDRMIRHLLGRPRKSLADLSAACSLGLPTILIDHTPFELEEARDQGIDLQLSGHTHGGQLFPITLLARNLYRQSHGYYRLGNTQYYVSCGYGSWGPPIRIGTRAEIVDIHIRFIKR